MYLAMHVCVNIHSSDQISLKVLICTHPDSLPTVSLNILMFMMQIGTRKIIVCVNSTVLFDKLSVDTVTARALLPSDTSYIVLTSNEWDNG